MKQTKCERLQGTRDLLILRTLASGEMHGWGVSQRLQQISQDASNIRTVVSRQSPSPQPQSPE